MIVELSPTVNIFRGGEFVSACFMAFVEYKRAVTNSTSEKGHVVLFSLNPFWRGQTAGSYSLVFNAILNFDNLNSGRKPDEK